MAVCAIASAATMLAQSYQVVVTTNDGERKVFATDDVSDIKFNNAPTYMEANHMIEATYSPNSENGTYSLIIGTDEPDGDGMPAAMGDMQIGLIMHAPLSQEAQNAVLPEGYYRVENTNAPFSVSPIRSLVWVRYSAEENGVTTGYIIDGTVDVRHEGENYDLRTEIDLVDGSHLDISYYGKIKFTVTASGSVDFESDQDVTFTEGQGRIWANWFAPFCDDGSLQFFTGTFDNNNKQTEGYSLVVPYYMPKSDTHTPTWKPVMADGTYKVDRREIVTSQTYLPFTLQQGTRISVFGETVVSGAYITYLAPDGRISLAIINGGTMTVSDNGTKFEFDFTTVEGIKVTGTYDGAPYIVNMIDNSNKPEFQDNLTGDYELNKFPGNTAIVDYNLGDYIIEGVNSHVVMFTEPEMKTGDYIMLELLSDSEEELKDGVYKIDNSLTDFSGIKGVVTFQGGMEFSWYGDLDSTDDEGYQTRLAPISGGTVTVSTTEDGQRKFDFDLRDLKGNKITGSLTRKMAYVPNSPMNQAKLERFSKRALGKAKRTWSKRNTDFQPRVLMPRK